MQQAALGLPDKSIGPGEIGGGRKRRRQAFERLGDTLQGRFKIGCAEWGAGFTMACHVTHGFGMNAM